MRYVRAKYDSYNDTLTYRTYIAETLYQYTRGNGLNVHLMDVIHPKPVDNRSGDEIALDVISKAGLTLQTED